MCVCVCVCVCVLGEQAYVGIEPTTLGALTRIKPMTFCSMG